MGRRTLSSTLRHGKSTGDWKTTPMSFRGPAIAVPRNRASPAEAGRVPARILSRVDLPQPDGPTTATNSPSPTEQEISSSADTVPGPHVADGEGELLARRPRPGAGGVALGESVHGNDGGAHGGPLLLTYFP